MKGIYPEKTKKIVNKFKNSYYIEGYNVVVSETSEELKKICELLGVDYDEDYGVIDTETEHRIYL